MSIIDKKVCLVYIFVRVRVLHNVMTAYIKYNFLYTIYTNYTAIITAELLL